MFEPWSVISDNELKHLRQLVKDVSALERGCDCDYDYRCRRCSLLISALRTAAKAEQAR